MDELEWRVLWLYLATDEEKYYEKYKTIADVKYYPLDTSKFPCEGPISWDAKHAGCYILSALVSKKEKRMEEGYNYCDKILNESRIAWDYGMMIDYLYGIEMHQIQLVWWPCF